MNKEMRNELTVRHSLGVESIRKDWERINQKSEEKKGVKDERITGLKS